MTADHTHRKNNMTTTALPHQNIINAQRADAARAKLTSLAHLLFGEGTRPDIAASLAGYPTRQAARQAANHAGRPELAQALHLPSSAEQRAARIEDTEFLLDAGETPERIAIRAGFADLENARKMLIRWGREDLWERVSATLGPITDWDEDEA